MPTTADTLTAPQKDTPDASGAGTVNAGPFLRWAGGKRRLLPVLRAGMPTSYGRYVEPFLGGGALYFAANPPGSPGVLNDMNADLTAAYRAVRDSTDELIERLREHQAAVSEEWFYALRAAVPGPDSSDVERAARFIAYNRTSFNGLFRVNSRGGWNTPYGKLRNPTVCNEPLLRAVAAHLAGTDIRTGSYIDATADVTAGDFVYLDPPYLPLSATSSFSRYAADDFTVADHEQLARTAADLAARGAHVMLSNSDTPLTRAIFAQLDLHQVSVRRSISASAGSRETVTEILATTYPPELMNDPGTFAGLATRLS